MRYYYFNDWINSESIQKLCDFFKDGDGKVYFETSGGGLSETLSLIDILNENCEELIATRQIQSGGMVAFFNTTCKKRIQPLTIGMWHLPSRSYEIDSKGNIHGKINQFDRAQDNKYLKFGIDFAEKIGMSQEEIEEMLKGEDIFFTTERLQEMLNLSTNTSEPIK